MAASAAKTTPANGISKSAARADTRLFPTRNWLPEDARRQTVGLLNDALADLTDLYTQTKHAHWNVKGPSFYSLHKLLDELAELVEESMDEVAERATALGGVAFGTLRQAAVATRLPEFPTDVHHNQQVAGLMADRFAAVSNRMGKDIGTTTELGDNVTSDLLTEVARNLDKGVYLLEAHVQLDDG